MNLLLVSRRLELVARLRPELHAQDRERAEQLLPFSQLVLLDLELPFAWELLHKCPRPVLAISPPTRVQLRNRRAYVDGLPLELSAREYEVLRVLVNSPGRSFSREELQQVVWGETAEETRRVDLVVSKLRRKLKLPFIHSVWGVGYRYEE